MHVFLSIMPMYVRCLGNKFSGYAIILSFGTHCWWLVSGAHRILWTRKHITPYTTNITGEIQSWRPNTNNSIIQIRKISTLLSIIITCKEWKESDLCGYVPSNEEFLVSSDTPSSKRIRWYMVIWRLQRHKGTTDASKGAYHLLAVIS